MPHSKAGINRRFHCAVTTRYADFHSIFLLPTKHLVAKAIVEFVENSGRKLMGWSSATEDRSAGCIRRLGRSWRKMQRGLLNFRDRWTTCFGGAVFQVLQNPSNHPILSDKGDDAHGRAALGADQRIRLEDPSYQVCPSTTEL